MNLIMIQIHFIIFYLQISLLPMYYNPLVYILKPKLTTYFVNSLEYTSYSGNLLIEIFDHLIQFLILEGFIKERPIPILNMYKRDYSNFNENEFKEAVDGLDWHSIVDIIQKDPNHSLNNFYNSITYLLDEFAPKKRLRGRNINSNSNLGLLM